MHRRYSLPLMTLLALTALLTACGGNSATDTPKPAAPPAATAAPTTASSAASSATSATRPAGSTAATSSVAATNAPTAAASSAASGTRPASSATTGSVTAGSTTATGSGAAGTSITLFTDPKGRFSFSRPAAWTIGQSTSPDTIVQFNATNPLGVVDISTESVPGSTTPDKYLDAALTEIKKSIPDAQQMGTLNLQLDTEPAIQIDYTGTVSGSKIYFSQIFALHTGTAYVLTLGTQPADIEKMKQAAVVVIQTWKFLR